ncbi:MAG: ACT domain-containing protein [Pseudomonadota bacterium]
MKHTNTELVAMMATLHPTLHEGVVVFCVLQDQTYARALPVIATIAEPEGTSLVLREDDAMAAGLDIQYRAAWITLNVQSKLSAVGLTAAVSAALADRGISCNVIAGVHHDHLFVPEDSGHNALNTLRSIPSHYFQNQLRSPLW